MIITNPEPHLQAEVVVIGSGPGGAVSAALLAEGGRDVLLIEEGSYYPQDSARAFSYQEMVQKYRNSGITVALGKPNIPYAEGCCVGGGSEVNSAVYHRMPDEVAEQWARASRLEDFTAAGLTPWFEQVELEVQPATYPDTLPSGSTVLRRGAEGLNWQSKDVPRLVDLDKETDKQGVPVSRRRSMTRTFIPRFEAAGGRLVPDMRALKLRREGGDWVVSTLHASRMPVSVRAKHVIVAAGAVHTPSLLQRSGIRRNVGRTFSLQPMVKLTARFNEAVNFSGMGIAGEQVKEFMPEFSFGCAISSRAHLAINLLGEADGTQTAVNEQDQLISYYVMTAGTNAGRVGHWPGFDSPVVRYPLSHREARNLAGGATGLSRLLLEAGAQRVYTGLREQPHVDAVAELDTLPAELKPDSTGVMTVHIMGSAPMGENRELAAVDSWGRVHGVENLRVMDASIFCGSLGTNPQGTIMALAARNADHFLNES